MQRFADCYGFLRGVPGGFLQERLLVGTRTSVLYEMDMRSYSYTIALAGHARGAIRGLATHPRRAIVRSQR